MQRLGTTFGETYEIVGPRGDRAVLNDSSDPDFVGYLVGDNAVTGLERAGVRESADELPEQDGGVHGAFKYGRMAFTMAGMIQAGAPPYHDAQDKLLRATDAMDADARLLWTANGVDVMLDFRQQQPTRITNRLPKLFQIAGASERNVIRSQAEHATDINPGAATPGGFVSPLVSPLVSGAGADGEGTLTNEGRSGAWPILEIHGPCTNPSIRNVSHGDRGIYLVYTLVAGEVLYIDTDPRKRTVTLNEQASRYSALDFARSAWFGLLPGDNVIRVAFNSYSAGAKVRVRWRDAWG